MPARARASAAPSSPGPTAASRTTRLAKSTEIDQTRSGCSRVNAARADRACGRFRSDSTIGVGAVKARGLHGSTGVLRSPRTYGGGHRVGA